MKAKSSDASPSALMAPWLSELKPYPAEASGDMVKLDAMENPYAFPAELRQAWYDTLAAVEINRYPDPQAVGVKTAWRQLLDLPGEAQLLVGNGSDEIIHMLCLAYNQPGACMLSPAPSFAVYPLAAQAVNMHYVGVPLAHEDFRLNRSRFIEAVESHKPNLIFIASPNNPTGNKFAADDIRAIAEHSNGLVVLDEAYWRFSGSNCIKQLFDLDNIVFMHTLSKIGLAGVRLGALIGKSAWLEPLERVRMPYNVSSLTQATAKFAIEHDQAFQVQVDELCRAREKMHSSLSTLPGVTVWPSQTNFILFRVEQGAESVHQRLISNGVLIKKVHGAHPALENCLRVSIGTASENATFLEQLASACRA